MQEGQDIQMAWRLWPTGLVSLSVAAAHMECSNCLTIEGDVESSMNLEEVAGRDMVISSGPNTRPAVEKAVVGMDHNKIQDP